MIKSSHVFLDLFLLFVRSIEDRSKYHKIDFRYTYVSNFVRMTFDYDLCRFSLQNMKECIFCWCISVELHK